jgi:hypothetical protein
VNLLIGDSGAWHWADLFLRPEPTSLTPPIRRRRWFVVYGGYAAFDSSPPAIMFVVPPAKMIVAAQFAGDGEVYGRADWIEVAQKG